MTRTTKPKARKKRNYRKRRLMKHAPIGKSLGFPKSQRVQLRYATYLNLADNVGGLMDTHFFRANGIHDPDVATGGGSPLGSTQWEAFYNHYRVVESRITVHGASYYQVAQQQPAVIGVYLSDDAVVPSAWDQLVESGRGSWYLDNNLNTEVRKLTCKYTQSGFFKGQGKNQSQLGAAVSADPAEQALFCVYIQSVDGLAITTPRSFMVIIDYLVEFSEPKDLPAS